jgi:5-(carboxyamino)imidazole ribonucleotide synthase
MLALAGHPLGLELVFVDPNPDAPAGQVAELVAADYGDAAALRALERCDVVTYEFENVPLDVTRRIAAATRVLPPPRALEVARDRLLEKRCFRELGIPTPAFRDVGTERELGEALSELGLPAVLKARRQGYDGKGQAVIEDASAIAAAWQRLSPDYGADAFILESKVAFERELSIIAVRGAAGDVRSYPLIENRHRDGILDVSIAPAPGITPELAREAEAHARRLLEHFDYVGVLALELFQVGGRLLANELAPRVHNSGHLTIEAASTSQFENHLRAIVGWPLGAVELTTPACMLNLVGALPDPAPALALGGAHFHDYGKPARRGRKLGHVTVCASTAELGLERLERLRAELRAPGGEAG